ncbi:MAG: class I SAM-dependent methyltransferase [Myxococcales bacterium]|nr:class I SAM-dependent methyltransferase [Myxococcales bacterium]
MNRLFRWFGALGLMIGILGAWGCKRNATEGAGGASKPVKKKGHKGMHHHGKDHHKGDVKYKHHDMQHDFSDVKRYAKIFDDPARKAWQKPEEVVTKMQIKPGMAVADIGAGTGYFLPFLQSAVGEKGSVEGLDINGPMVQHMKERIQKAGWSQVKARQVKMDDPQLQAASLDRVLIVNTWHHVANRVEYAKKLKAGLKPGGAVYIVDFTMEAKRGPNKKHRLEPQQVIKEFAEAGLKGRLIPSSLPDQYIVEGAL